MEAVDSIKELPVDGRNEPCARFFKNELATKLDWRVKVMAPQLQHQCDRGIPVKPLESGVTDLTKLHGQEMPALLLMLIVSVGDEGAILPVAMSRPFAALIWALLCLDAYVMAAAWDIGMRGRFKDVVRYVMDGFTALVGPRRTSASDDTGLKFPKYHQLVHLFDQEAEWGPLILGYGGFWESAMKFFVKKTTLRTQRRAGTLVAQVMKRLGLIESFRTAWTALTEHYARFCARPAAVAPEDAVASGKKARLAGRRLPVDLADGLLVNDVLEVGATAAIYDFFDEESSPARPERIIVRTELKLPQHGAEGAKIFRSDSRCAHLYAEIQGFFAVDDGKSFAVIQWLKPGKRARVGSFPFDSWSREVAEPATTSHPCRFEFQVVPVECITCVAFVVPNPDKVGHFWIVPPKAEWHLFHAPPKFPR
ncbi:hypothetical protein M885DRAFT_580961 [Pelagophyceae sp. CCMP2097]|nr:hypothetical protein M885DRAFT_580961 [Pelagophyceae sp. CCMP2097]